jgi:hypothetical protein
MILVQFSKSGSSRMSMRFVVLAAVVLLASGCTRDDGRQAAQAAVVHFADAQRHLVAAGSTTLAEPRSPARGFAKLPDRGNLVAYPGGIVRQDGAYTWYRTDLSEEHALRAIAIGRLRVTTPDGEILDFQYDRHIEHPSGDWTWIGHRPGHEGEQTILTFGAEAAYGSVAQSDKPPLRLTMRDGVGWLVETDPAKVAGIVNAATHPRRPDYHIVPESELPRRATGVTAAADGATASPGTSASSASATSTSATTVDLIIGYTSGFASAHGGASGATTRLNYLVDVANAAYGNSKVDTQVQLVKAMQVAYTDTNSNDTALEQLSGYKSGSGPVPPNAAFTALRAAREQYGADLVSLVRDFRDPEQDGCGLAWLLGGALQGIGAGEGWDELAYSVVGDGSDIGSDGKSYYCLDETLAHELGHNMGAAHDKETAKGDDGVLDNPDDYGAYTYSFGYKTGATTGNFYTIMAYGGSGQKIYRTFSNPTSTFCGGRACGTSSADNARTLRQTIPVVAGFRESIARRTLLRRLDANGDGKSDLLFYIHDENRFVIWFMDGTSRIRSESTPMDGGMHLVDSGDFNGDGKDDLLFVNNASRSFKMALRTDNGYSIQALPYTYSDTAYPLAVGDIDGNHRADIVFRGSTPGLISIWYMSGASRIKSNAFSVPTNYEFVACGDLNGDGRQDIVMTDASGHILLDTSKGTYFTTKVLSSTYKSSSYLVGAGDINGDGRADLLFTSGSGTRVVAWMMNGSIKEGSFSGEISTAYRLPGHGDFDGDRRDDIILFNPSNRQITFLFSTGHSFSASTLALRPKSGSDLMDVQYP